jgi:processive 1,2-diacylglycerol beta-glucosyltransferase
VAQALAQAFTVEGAHPEVADHFARFVSPLFARASRSLFWIVLRRAPRLWGLAYNLAAWLPPRSPAMAGMDRLGARALGRELQTGVHDLVVHVHPTPSGAMSWLRARGATSLPHAVVLTDFVVHPQWIYPHVDRYFVPDDAIREALVARGLPPERVVVSGVPVDHGFALPPERSTLREELGLDRELPTVLVVGGMHGWLGGIAEVCEVLMRLPVPFQAVVVCGSRADLETRLAARFGRDPRFRVLGYVREMHRVMGAVDLVVTKAGAVTCAEALALERPLVFYRSLPGQERANAAFLERAGAGVRATDRAALASHLAVLLSRPARRRHLAAAARRLRRPEAAHLVAKEMLALAGRGEEQPRVPG